MNVTNTIARAFWVEGATVAIKALNTQKFLTDGRDAAGSGLASGPILEKLLFSCDLTGGSRSNFVRLVTIVELPHNAIAFMGLHASLVGVSGAL